MAFPILLPSSGHVRNSQPDSDPILLDLIPSHGGGSERYGIQVKSFKVK